MSQRGITARRIWYTVLFIIYMAILVYMLFLSDMFGRRYLAETYRYNLVPFKEIKNFRKLVGGSLNYLYVLNVLGNIGIFAPYGFLVAGMLRKRHGLAVLFGFLFSLTAETIQLLCHVGVFDVDDIILNTLGAFAGFIFWKIISGLRKKHYEKKRC